MSLTSELLELSQHLQQEHLFVSTEREQLQRLYHNVTVLSERLFHTAWIARQQKLALQQFIEQGSNAADGSEAYSVNNQLEETNFMDSYKMFSYHDSKYGELFKFLYENPKILATIIIEAEKIGGLNVSRMISLTVTSIYGNCIFQEDEQAVLRLLKTLLDSQVANSENPRRLIQRQNMSFSLVYRHLCETLFSARLFLTAALYDPIMRLLMEDEWFFDIDPDKAVVRFPSGEKLRRFGEPGTEEHKQKQAQYRSFIVEKLYCLAVRFINSIKANIHCFPASLGWLVSQMYRVLTERGQVSMQEVRASCADLVFALFICPAICDPEPHGITSDVPISHIARHNLMQMAQILQVLAISQWEQIDPKVRDLYGRFEKGCMSSVLDLFLEGPWEDITDQLAAANQSQGNKTSRSAVLLTFGDVREMIGFLRNTAVRLDDKVGNKKPLEQLLSALPADMPPSSMDSLTVMGGGGVISPLSASSASSGLTPDPPSTPSTERKLFKSKGQKKKRSITNAPQLEDVMGDNSESDNKTKPSGDVLVLSIYPPGDCPGMLPETKVLSSVPENQAKKEPPNPGPPTDTVAIATPQVAPNPEIQEKRTRFSLSHDQESIGNASDYQEVISEAASSHSVEDENEPETDNFSDVMSANVSGRGSPSISGRDTPLSQAGSVEENPPAPQLPVPVPETVRKENRVDVTERFGKFEIKAELAMERDECKSTVSDTWSTDVLASDSEPPEQNQVDRLEEVAEEISRPLLLGSEPISEISETASDAWSTDVLASDTEEKHSELLKDLEQDLISGVLDREEGDNSLGHDDGDDHHLGLDHMGAVGGGNHPPSQQGSDPLDVFADVFSDPSPKTTDAGEKAGNGKKISSIVHHFQCGPNLQLPSIHRLPSQSLKHAEGRVSNVLGTLEGNSPGSSTASTTTGTLIPSSTGARSKVRDKRKEKESREGRGNSDGGGAGGDGGVSDFDPLAGSGSGHTGGRRRSKEKWAWAKGSRGNSEPQKFDSSTLFSHSDPQTLPEDSPPPGAPAVNQELPAPPTAGRGGHTSSRDSGIDIWVNTNGQMSGSSSRSPASALITARSSLDSNITPRHPAPLPGRSSLDSNLQRYYSVLSSTPDSGINSSYMSSTVNSSLDTNTPPGEIDNPLFTFPNPQTTSSSERPRNGNNNNDLLFNSESQISKTSPTKPESTLLQMAATATDPKADKPQPSVVKFNRKLRRSIPHTDEVSNIFKKISIDEDEPSGETNTGQQQISNLNERRLSSALTSYDPFSTETDDPSLDLVPESDDSAFTDSKTANDANLDFLSPSKPNGMAVIIQEDQRSDSEPIKGQGHSRQDSSGSNQSASSLKLMSSGEVTTAKEPAGDTISVVSDERDFGSEGTGNKKGSSGGFLKSMKDKFHKGIKRKNTKFERDLDSSVQEDDATPTLKPGMSNTPKSSPILSHPESTDDILEKYRTPKKTALNKSGSSGNTNNNNSFAVNNNATKSDSTDAATGASGSNTVGGGGRNALGSISDGAGAHTEDGRPPFMDSDNLESCLSFLDAKRKLRLVLSMGDVLFGLTQVQSSSPRGGLSTRENEVINVLNAQLAEAINLQNKDMVTQLYEAIRCMKMFDSDGCKKLLCSMREDYQNRSAYISYLVRSRQGLLATRNQLQRLLSRVNRDKEICSKHMTNICARKFLETKERRMWKFITEFQKLSMSDEKIDLVEQFLQHLYLEMSTDLLWKAATDNQIEDGQQAVERFLMSRIYTHAMFPNGDGDVMRDQLLQEHMRKLGKVITPSHKDLRIPAMYHLECPWPAAQKEIFMINAYRTPKDKIQCVLRCSQTIMNLLSMASVKSVPAADDFMPVLIFVLIKANPFGLLSTIQYVNSFYDNRLHGEEQYWWLQLTSAVEFIKTMEYST